METSLDENPKQKSAGPTFFKPADNSEQRPTTFLLPKAVVNNRFEVQRLNSVPELTTSQRRLADPTMPTRGDNNYNLSVNTVDCLMEAERTLDVDIIPKGLSGTADYCPFDTVTRNSSKANNFAQAIKRRIYSKRRYYRRLIFKTGECNISHVNIKKRKRRYLADIFTTLIDIQWRYSILLFILAFMCSWLGFSVVWWLIGFAHGDFTDEIKEKCVDNVNNFVTALLFSIETQHTIGYGTRAVTSNCPEAVFMIMMQSCFGVIVQALMTGLVFAKLARSKKRAGTLMFSKNAVICKRDGVMTLLFRVGDMRKSLIIGARVRGLLIKKRITSEGEVLPMEQYDVDFGAKEGRDELFLVWPVIIEHKIDSDSPFWDISAADLAREQFELVIILEGVVESTGTTVQARCSYLPTEILWGHLFDKLITYQKTNGQYQIDYEKFHEVRPIPHFPQCSARELSDIGEENMSAHGYIQDDDVSLASKSVTLSSGSNLGQMYRRQASNLRRQAALNTENNNIS